MTSLSKNKSCWIKQGREILIIGLVSIPWAYAACQECFYDLQRLTVLLTINFCIWLILWKGNSYTVYLVNKKYSWLKYPAKRLMAGIVAHTLFTSTTLICIFYFFRWVLNISLGDFKFTLLFSIAITFLISLILHSISFLRSWRKLAVESERIKKEVISAKYESLKNQVNPHFLFNSLNALINLVYEDQDQAAKFIKKLSDVYRYVLESRDKDLVPLSTELKFVESYLFLQKIRYGESLKTSMTITEMEGYQVPPLSIQMLVENAIKHNIISEDDALQVEISLDDSYLWVVNNLQKKNSLKSASSEVGLSNIKARYLFLTDKPVIISDVDQKFKVGLPLLNTT